jgi:GNAT superfamily N-acetyltransferase
MMPDGYAGVAPGKIASVVTYVEMLDRPALSHDGGVNLRRLRNPSLEEYRSLFRRAGAQWLWFSRLQMNDLELGALLAGESTETFLAEREGQEIGLAELDRTQSPEVEIASFALFPEAMGKGWGRPFMNSLLEQAWKGATTRVWLHTCTLDSPGALGFYLKSGFRPYKRAIEVADDPRLRGTLPLEAAPQVPIIR